MRAFALVTGFNSPIGLAGGVTSALRSASVNPAVIDGDVGADVKGMSQTRVATQG